jgi:V/A-type H+-transporting ATPase subunit E
MLDTGKSKLQKILEILKKETLEPAKQEAREIVENAQLQAKKILESAKKEGEKLLLESREEMKKEKKIFESALFLSSKQVIESLKQNIEGKLFKENLFSLIGEETKKPEVLAQLITAIVQAIKEKGIDAELSSYVSRKIDPKKINDLLMEKIKDQLKGKGVLLEDFSGGVRVYLQDKEITFDLSNEAIVDLVIEYLRPEFRSKVWRE